MKAVVNRERLEKIFAENFTKRGELGASVSVWKNGCEVLDLAGGWIDRAKTKPWTSATPVLIWSATKGLAAACTLRCLQENHRSLATRVSEIWPEFGRAG